MKKTTLAAQSGAGIALLALMATLAQADSTSYSDISGLEFDINSAAMAASAAIAGKIIEAELETDDGETFWEVDILNEENQVVTVEIDGQTGKVLSTSTDDDDDAELPLDSAISLSRAIEIVQAIEKGAIVEAELENDSGALIWEVESVSADNEETKIRVNAETGEILL